eukprot:10055902-Alexandrium_andersonii.AAC.1
MNMIGGFIPTFGGRQSLHLPAFDSIHGAFDSIHGAFDSIHGAILAWRQSLHLLAFAALAGGIILLIVEICPASADENEENAEHSDTATASGTPVA